MTAFHSWLIRQRIYCQRCADLTKATTVQNINGKDEVMCDTHARRLADARKSDKLQDLVKQETKTPNLHA